jgi:hypothetical protein
VSDRFQVGLSMKGELKLPISTLYRWVPASAHA